MNYTYKIEQDDCLQSPRDWDNVGIMYCKYRNYTLGDIQIDDNWQSLIDDYGDGTYDGRRHNIEDMTTLEAFKKYVELTTGEKVVVILPLEGYEHSGITMWVGHNPDHVDYRWDCSHVGYVVATVSQCKKMGVAYSTAKAKKRLIEYLEGEVKTYAQYLEGDVYSFTIKDDTGEIIESCGGFYGYDECESEAKSIIEYQIEKDRQDRQAKLKSYIKNSVPLQYRQA